MKKTILTLSALLSASSGAFALSTPTAEGVYILSDHEITADGDWSDDLAALITDIQAVGYGTIVINQATPLDDSLTIPNEITLRFENGGYLDLRGTTHLLTLNCSIHDTMQWVMRLEAPSNVTGSINNSWVRPEWYGVDANGKAAGTAGDEVAMRAAKRTGTHIAIHSPLTFRDSYLVEERYTLRFEEQGSISMDGVGKTLTLRGTIEDTLQYIIKADEDELVGRMKYTWTRPEWFGVSTNGLPAETTSGSEAGDERALMKALKVGTRVLSTGVYEIYQTIDLTSTSGHWPWRSTIWHGTQHGVDRGEIRRMRDVVALRLKGVEGAGDSNQRVQGFEIDSLVFADKGGQQGLVAPTSTMVEIANSASLVFINKLYIDTWPTCTQLLLSEVWDARINNSRFKIDSYLLLPAQQALYGGVGKPMIKLQGADRTANEIFFVGCHFERFFGTAFQAANGGNGSNHIRLSDCKFEGDFGTDGNGNGLPVFDLKDLNQISFSYVTVTPDSHWISGTQEEGGSIVGAIDMPGIIRTSNVRGLKGDIDWKIRNMGGATLASFVYGDLRSADLDVHFYASGGEDQDLNNLYLNDSDPNKQFKLARLTTDNELVNIRFLSSVADDASRMVHVGTSRYEKTRSDELYVQDKAVVFGNAAVYGLLNIKGDGQPNIEAYSAISTLQSEVSTLDTTLTSAQASIATNSTALAGKLDVSPSGTVSGPTDGDGFQNFAHPISSSKVEVLDAMSVDGYTSVDLGPTGQTNGVADSPQWYRIARLAKQDGTTATSALIQGRLMASAKGYWSQNSGYTAEFSFGSRGDGAAIVPLLDESGHGGYNGSYANNDNHRWAVYEETINGDDFYVLYYRQGSGSRFAHLQFAIGGSTVSILQPVASATGNTEAPATSGTLVWSSMNGVRQGINNGAINTFNSIVAINAKAYDLQHQGYHLYVNGKIYASELVTDQNTYADFVFEDDYPRPRITDWEAFIEENGHLPGVPSAEETKNGVPIGQLQQAMLQKIEELTLIVIDQNKALEEQKAAIETQREELEQLRTQLR
ncbi:MAG: hypothetical protein Q7P63_13625 [Verrucomicrobiota bacterium JB022]|nr:hypothetical protein [Verrucomicrobiota bacterium JB022]